MNEEQNLESTPVTDAPAEEMKMPQNAPPVEETEEKPVRGPVILLLGVLLLAVLVGLALWFNNLNQAPTEPAPAPVERPTEEENNEPESTTAEARTDNMETVSTSDEISAIEADLESTDFDSFDSDMNAIESEFESSGSS